jgi:hypothetical protein
LERHRRPFRWHHRNGWIGYENKNNKSDFTLIKGFFMKYTVKGAFRETGMDIALEIEAENQEQAERLLSQQGILITSIYPDNKTPGDEMQASHSQSQASASNGNADNTQIQKNKQTTRLIQIGNFSISRQKIGISVFIAVAVLAIVLWAFLSNSQEKAVRNQVKPIAVALRHIKSVLDVGTVEEFQKAVTSLEISLDCVESKVANSEMVSHAITASQYYAKALRVWRWRDGSDVDAHFRSTNGGMYLNIFAKEDLEKARDEAAKFFEIYDAEIGK